MNVCFERGNKSSIASGAKSALCVLYDEAQSVKVHEKCAACIASVERETEYARGLRGPTVRKQ